MSELDAIASRLPRRDAEILHAALRQLREIEADLREQASGEQDHYLLRMADRMRKAMSVPQ